VEFDKSAPQDAMNRAAAAHADTEAERFNALFAALHRRYAGKSVKAITAVLPQRWAAEMGTPLLEPHLSRYAQAVSDGEQLRFEVTPGRSSPL
jgi:hypothetical protein